MGDGEEKPPLIYFDIDAQLLEFQYNKELHGRFWADYHELDFVQFLANCHLLGGHYGEILNGRRYLRGEYKEAPKDFRIWAVKNCMTPELQEYRDRNKAEISLRNVAGRIGLLDGAAQANRERRLKERERKNFKSWR